MPLDQYGFIGNEIEGVKAEILAINSEYFNYLFKLNEFLQKIKFLFKINDQDIQKVMIAILFIKSIETMQSIYILCSYGLKNDVDVLLRALFESVVAIKYCLVDETNAKQYLAKDSFERKKRLNALVSSKSLSSRINVTDEEKNRILTEIDEELKFLDNPKEIRTEDICRSVGEHDLYNTFYRTVSDSAHSGPRVFSKFFSVEDNRPKFVWGPNDKDVKMPLITSAEFIMKVVPKMVDLLCPEKHEEANNLIKDFNELAKLVN
ncbi:MAG: hypothetical protein HQ596_03980 [Candidatus Saganbacteria bacterium]|nr:hypothetical protein [Candidatus Saganbacteria bacterium]